MGFLDLSAASVPEVTVQAKPPSSATGSNCRDPTAALGGGDGGDNVPGIGNASVAVGREAEPGVFVSKHVSALQTVEGFLDALTNASRCATGCLIAI